MFLARCPACGYQNQIPPIRSRQQVTCASCQRSFVVTPVAEAPPASDNPPTAAPPESPAASGGSPSAPWWQEPSQVREVRSPAPPPPLPPPPDTALKPAPPSAEPVLMAKAVTPPPKAAPIPAKPVHSGSPPNRTILASLAPPEEPIRYYCPRCGHAGTAPRSQAGQKLPCPQCGQRLRLPLPPSPPSNQTILASLAPAGPAPRPAAAQVAPPAAQHWRTWVLLGSLLGGKCVAGSGSAGHYYTCLFAATLGRSWRGGAGRCWLGK